MSDTNNNLFPSIEPHKHGMLKVDDIHSLYWEECGNPNGVPIVFLHGGPGSGCNADQRRFFDPSFYRIILFDQRGAGRSTPHAELKNNSPQHLIADLEALRQFLHVKQWLLFGGSWGSTLAIAYGETHPQHCLGFILRGIFLMAESEKDWFMHGAQHIFPEAWEEFAHFIPENERHDLLKAYTKRIADPDPAIHIPAAKHFSVYEGKISYFMNSPKKLNRFEEEHLALGMARMESHYFTNYGKELGDTLLKNVPRIRHLPCIIVQGRYDICTPITTAYQLAKAWPNAEFIVVPDAGHSTTEPGITRELVNATEKFKTLL